MDTYTFDSPQDHARLVPAFTRLPANPILTTAASGSPSMYWPWVLKVAGLIPSPLDTYYMWFSTDHDPGAGGIYLATAPHPAGPWTSRGLVYVDPAGAATETPSVVWNEHTGLFHLFFKESPGTGQLKLVTSPDGRTGWTSYGEVIASPSPSYPGDGFTGYFRPGRLGNLWFGHHLMGGGDHPHYGISYSHDGINWQVDPRPMMYGQHLMPDMLANGAARKIEWNSGQILSWHGRLMWVGELANFASGTNPVDRVIGCAPIAPDLRTLLGPPDVLLTPDPVSYPWESTNLRAMFLLHDDPDGTGDRLWMYYQCGSAAFGLAVAAVGA